MIKASRPWLVAIAFVGAAVLGGPLLVVWGLVVGYGSFLLKRDAAGIYAVAGHFSALAVMLVMLLCGTTGAILAYNQLRR